MFSTLLKSQIFKISILEIFKFIYRYFIISILESLDNNISDDFFKIFKREFRLFFIKSIILKLVIFFDEDKDKGLGVKGESFIFFDLEGIFFYFVMGFKKGIVFLYFYSILFFYFDVFYISVIFF